MLSDMDIPWLALKDDEKYSPSWSGFVDVTDDDTDGSLDDDVAVTEGLDSMIIEDSAHPVQPAVSVGDTLFPKRKRTSSLVTPPKVRPSCTMICIFTDV
jgi:hypothetical protein